MLWLSNQDYIPLPEQPQVQQEDDFIQKLIQYGRVGARERELSSSEQKAKQENDNFWDNFEPRDIRRSYN